VLGREELDSIRRARRLARPRRPLSFALFALGAVVPVLPFFFLQGNRAVLVSLLLSALGLFGIGSAITLFTGKSILLSGTRQLILGLAAAGVTYALGHLLGMAIGG
jgi:VIT1/CCC1 family predicted Fe2+/Mn2+ transporter